SSATLSVFVHCPRDPRDLHSFPARRSSDLAGADDALFLTVDGFLSEATTANVFLVRGDELATPALGCAILPGTTRSWILGWAGRSEEHTSELQSRSDLVCRLLLEKKKKKN